MNKEILKRKDMIIAFIISIFGIVAIRFNGNPHIYMGLVIAYIAIVLAGLFVNKWMGLVLGGLIISIGYVLRKFYPVVSTLTGEKLDNFLIEEQAYNAFFSKYLILLILLGMLVGFLFGKIAEIIREDNSNKFTANKIANMAVFVALGVIVNTMRIGSISFGGFPIILSGYLLGPVPGFIIGGVTDIVAFLVRPSVYGFNIIFSLTSALTGLIPVIVTRLLGEKYPNYSFLKVLIGVFIGQISTSVVIVPIFSSILYGRIFLEVALSALIKQLISIPIYSFFVVTMTDRLGKVMRFKE